MSLVLLGILNSQAAAAGGGPAYDLLETQVLTSSASSVSFTGLGSYTDYKHLQLRMTLRSTWTLGSQSLNVYGKFNSSTTSNYSWHDLNGEGSSVSSNAGTGQEYFRIRTVASQGDADSGAFGAAILDILDFSNTNKNTTTRALAGVNATDNWISLNSGLWQTTSAVTSISFELGAGNIDTGSRFSLYGVK
jgi:hypothetical protein